MTAFFDFNAISNTDALLVKVILVRQYVEEHADKSGAVPVFDVYIVWNCFILGNIKAMLSTTICDGMYYEVTFNASKNEIYFDAYKKFENRKVDM